MNPSYFFGKTIFYEFGWNKIPHWNYTNRDLFQHIFLKYLKQQIHEWQKTWIYHIIFLLIPMDNLTCRFYIYSLLCYFDSGKVISVHYPSQANIFKNTWICSIQNKFLTFYQEEYHFKGTISISKLL